MASEGDFCRFFTESWGANKGLGEAPKSCTRKEHESATNPIAKRGQGAIAPCRVKGQRPLWGLGQRPNCSSSDQSQGSRQQRCRQRSVPASNFALPQERPQAALPTTCTLSRQMGATELLDFRFCLLSPNILFNPSPKTDQHGITPCWSVLYSAYFSGASGVVGVGSTGALP